MEDQLESILQKFIVETFLYGDQSAAPRKEDSFMEKGIIDSMGVLELVTYLETKMGIPVYDEEIIPSNFDSVEKLTRYIKRKRNGGAHAG
ncbi:MAG TPA: acyl carrier protein [Candidatus Manganitrophaceae bacterium]